MAAAGRAATAAPTATMVRAVRAAIVPIVPMAAGKAIAEIPTVHALDDSLPFSARHTHARVMKIWKEEFDAIYASDRFCVLVVHPRSGWGSGTPVRTQIFAEAIAYMQSHPGVQFFDSAGFARWCLEHPQHLEELDVGERRAA